MIEKDCDYCRMFYPENKKFNKATQVIFRKQDGVAFNVCQIHYDQHWSYSK